MGLGSTIDGGRMAEKCRSLPWVELAVPVSPSSHGAGASERPEEGVPAGLPRRRPSTRRRYSRARSSSLA